MESQVRFHPRHNFGGLEGLGDEVNAPRFEALDLVCQVIEATEEDHGNPVGFCGAFQPAAYFEPVEIGQPDIEQDQLGGIRLGKHQRRCAVRRASCLVAFTGQEAIERLPCVKSVSTISSLPFTSCDIA